MNKKTYITTKVVQAEPMDYSDFARQFRDNPDPGGENRPGYIVFYPDGYISWSPKGVFEGCAREATAAEANFVKEDFLRWHTVFHLKEGANPLRLWDESTISFDQIQTRVKEYQAFKGLEETGLTHIPSVSGFEVPAEVENMIKGFDTEFLYSGKVADNTTVYLYKA